MPRVVFKAKLRKWGNTFGLAISRKEVERLRAREGTELTVEASTEPPRVDYEGIAVHRDPEPDAGARHDELLAEGWMRRKRGRRG